MSGTLTWEIATTRKGFQRKPDSAFHSASTAATPLERFAGRTNFGIDAGKQPPACLLREFRNPITLP